MQKKRYDVITLGSATIDVFANTDATYIKTRNSGSKELLSYPAGSKILINDLRFEIGGGGTNTALAFSRLGLKTAWLGKLGDDEPGKQIKDFLKKNKIDFLGNSGDGKTGYSVILDSKGHDRTILTHKGENNFLDLKTDIDVEKLNTRWFYFSSMMGRSFQTQKKLARFAKKKNIKLAFNPSSYQARQGYKSLGSILKNTELLVLNLEEANLLLQKNLKNTDNILKRLSALGPKMVIVTNGPEGAYCLDSQDNTKYTIYPHDSKILETTGAGDAFASSFLSGYMIKKNIKDALRYGLANSESVIRNYGAKNILLTKEEIEKKIKRPTKITDKKI